MSKMNPSKTNLIQALKHYNACILLSIITAQALFSFSIPMFSSSETLPWLLPVLGGAVVLLHLLGVFNYYMALKNLDLVNLKMVALYLVLPLPNHFRYFFENSEIMKEPMTIAQCGHSFEKQNI